MAKNPDLYLFISANNLIDEKIRCEFCPLTSCEVERSFSIYKAFLRDNRQRFTKDNIKKHLVIRYNCFL